MRLAADESLSAFRSELESWLDENLPAEGEMEKGRNSTADLPPWARAWQRRLFEAGWLVPGWPPELGGRDASPEELMAYFEILARREVPRSLNPQGLSIVAPSIVDWGTDEQRERYALATLRGEISWCIGMSEPDAGSDLASLSTRAELGGGPSGANFVVNGQKVWTSGAHDADYCLCFVRTDPGAPKHRGISALIIDMASAGITCRPLPELTDQDHADFDEVFFDDVVVPQENLVGDLNGGWKVSQGSLGHERSMLWIMNVTRVERTVAGLVRLASDGTGAGESAVTCDASYADAVASLAIDAQAMRCLGYRGLHRAAAGQAPPEHAILKLFASETERKACLLGMDALGPAGLDLDGPGPLRPSGAPAGGVPATLPGDFERGSWAVQYLRSFAGTIAGGTSEIQRNIIAERVLGLPRS